MPLGIESFESVLKFLKLLGFESDATGAKLICEVKPSRQVVFNAYQVLNTYCSTVCRVPTVCRVCRVTIDIYGSMRT